MPNGTSCNRLTPPALLPLLLLCTACEDPPGPAHEAFTTWITEPEYRFGDAPEQEVFFTVPFLRADPYRDRILVRDRGDKQISAWTPDGSLLFVVGGDGEGPGEFTSPSRIYFAPDGGFSVRDDFGIRFTSYAADGEHLETVSAQDGTLEHDGLMLNLEAPAGDGYLGFPLTWAALELGDGGDPLERIAVVHATRSEVGQRRAPEPLFWMDIGGRVANTKFPDGTGLIGGQPFTDADQARFLPGTVVAMRMRGLPPGAVDLIEVNAEGDTVWWRRLQLEPRPLTTDFRDAWMDEQLEWMVPALSEWSEDVIREALDASVHKPEYLPAATGLVLTASGEVWVRTDEAEDTLRVHYAVRRGDTDGAARRVLLPEWLEIEDATDTHVWGVRRDEMDLPRVTGRRLVPAGS